MKSPCVVQQLRCHGYPPLVSARRSSDLLVLEEAALRRAQPTVVQHGIDLGRGMFGHCG